MLNVVPVQHSTVSTIIFLTYIQYVVFRLGFKEIYIFPWILAALNVLKANYSDFLFSVLRNFLRIFRKFRPNFKFVFRVNFAKLKENFAKHEIDNFAKFSQKHENENFCSHPRRSH